MFSKTINYSLKICMRFNVRYLYANQNLFNKKWGKNRFPLGAHNTFWLKGTKEETTDKQKALSKNQISQTFVHTVSSSKRLWNVIRIQGALFKHPFLHVGGQGRFPSELEVTPCRVLILSWPSCLQIHINEACEAHLCGIMLFPPHPHILLELFYTL